MSEFRIPYPHELQELRRKVGLTQSQLAERVGISQSLIARIERGKVNPSVDTLKKILNIIEKEQKIHTSIRDLLNWKRRSSKLQNLVFVSPDDRVRKAVLLMRRHDISQLPVLRETISIGSIHERTIIKNLVAMGSKAVFSKSVHEIMDAPFPTLEIDESIDTAFKWISEGIDAILVLNEGQPIGIITKIDLIAFMKK